MPFHSWYLALSSAAPFSAALTATMPQVASYTAIRLLVGHADGVALELVVLSQAAFVTAAYEASLARVQRDVRGLGLSPGSAVNALEHVATDLLAMSHLSSTVTPPGGHP